MDEIWSNQTSKRAPVGGFKPVWNAALNALERAFSLAEKQTVEQGRLVGIEQVYQQASRYKDRANFVKLAKKAKRSLETAGITVKGTEGAPNHPVRYW